MIYFLWVTPQTLHHCLLIQTHNTAETVYASWFNCRFAESLSRVVTSHPFLIPVLDRGITEMHGPVSPSLWMPRASSSGCSTSQDYLIITWGDVTFISVSAVGRTHTHTHTHTHTYTHTHATQAHTCKGQGTCGSTWRTTFFIQNIEISIFLIGKSPFWSSNVNYTKVQRPWRSISA